MKTTFINSAILLFIISSFLSSCSFLLKEEFAQRKYYDFPRTKPAVSGSRDASASASSIDKSNILKEGENPSQTGHSLQEAPEPVFTSSSKSKEIIIAANTQPVSPDNIISNSVKHDKPDQELVAPFKKRDVLNRERKQVPSAPHPDSDAMLIITVILAIVLPPLGVYLKDNSTSKWFWITFILCLISILGWGIIHIGPLGGLWFVAALIAVLHVLDVI